MSLTKVYRRSIVRLWIEDIEIIHVFAIMGWHDDRTPRTDRPFADPPQSLEAQTMTPINRAHILPAIQASRAT